MHRVDDLIQLFDSCFYASHNTRLQKGDSEPLYLPASDACPWHRILFAHGFFSSALHECAHWFIAGEKRRLLEDYGYWYAPDGRSASEQQAFYQVEVKPQAIEWILAQAAGYPFRISHDNLTGDTCGEQAFLHAVCQQAQAYCQQGLPPRAKRFYEALCHYYQGTVLSLRPQDYLVHHSDY
ncbi:MAG: elongation factor P hydroxylase [Legionellaceae bacterium]|nr:elongation factor P hydroxylase [Legionellaceae bacterium]